MKNALHTLLLIVQDYFQALKKLHIVVLEIRNLILFKESHEDVVI
jgi:hypothetical protein